MYLLKKTLIAAAFIFGSFSTYSATAYEKSSCSIEDRLEQFNAAEIEKLHALFNTYWDWSMLENPENATFHGYPGQNGRWTDLSQEAIDARNNFVASLLDSLNSIQTLHLNSEDQISYSILKKMLENQQIEGQFGSQYLLVDQMNGIHLSAALVMEMMPNNTVKDYQDILHRLYKLPRLLQQTTELLRQGIKEGITPPRISIQNVPQQLLNQITSDPLHNPFLRAFKNFPDSIDLAAQRRLSKAAKILYKKDVLPALKSFYTFITETYLPSCRSTTAFTDLPGGKEWYSHKVQSSTTTLLTPEQIHEIGLNEVERIHQEMLEVVKASGFKGSFAEFLHFLKTDPQFFYSNREELLNAYQTLTRDIEAKLPTLFSTLPHLPFEVIPIPHYSEESQVAAYYLQGSLIHNRPGFFFINTSFPEQRPKWEMEPLALHEAVPGHHLQITLAQELENLPEFRKEAHFTAYIEGWGLYAEKLGIELGFYQNFYSQFGRLTYEMLRATRLVVDTGMHAMGWSRDQAIDFFKQHVGGMSDHEIVTEVDRYLVMPAQALAYKIGELKIQEVRRKANQILGDKFDIRDFHNAWLRHGTLPLDIAEEQTQQWINQILYPAEKEANQLCSQIPSENH